MSQPVLYDRVRLGFMVFTLLWIGWYAQAQLSVVNVLAFISSLRTDFHWDYFLMAPLIFVLWFATAASILFWNRGAFCGWLCPFGALQELLNRAARLVKIPQLKIPFGVHQRLVALKYIVFLLLFGISLSALATAERAAEVEPFKTAIILRFVRDWPFVLYAVAMLAASLTVERFFCRYMCPLGAALAIPARLRMFDWLRRYRECGNPCQRCANDCPVQAIHPEGHINPNECIQCLHCQMLYHHDQKCPVMIQRRLKREKFVSSGPPPTFPRHRCRDRPSGRPESHPSDALQQELHMTETHRRYRAYGPPRTVGHDGGGGSACRHRRRGRLDGAGERRAGTGSTRCAGAGPARRAVSRGEAGRPRRILRVFIERTVRRDTHHRAAVLARADAHSGVQSRAAPRAGA